MDTILLAYTKTQVSKQTCLTKKGKIKLQTYNNIVWVVLFTTG